MKIEEAMVYLLATSQHGMKMGHSGIGDDYNHWKFSFPAPISKWYLAMPRSIWV